MAFSLEKAFTFINGKFWHRNVVFVILTTVFVINIENLVLCITIKAIFIFGGFIW